ncbi:hypothetical protein H696_03051 [Fonticula alba]|uniref:Endoplasmic reticulum transmembrane protein n=1 Tax=Fonticula alba TaxID=691883 RepID=A0A058Z9T8_FONAL|nr:hypothetical protein H696_03051 [Fonticula alba]KCV70698.1 hypothetical protein H696_03051 [Fonticula alba]|eukprot:XP_009495214.1 hypothetical protein H696_03051 [Fonticula alba]
MSLYTLVFGILVMEVVAFLLLMLPFSPAFRKKVVSLIANSPFAAKLKIGVQVVFVLVTLLFLESISRMYRLENEISQQQAVYNKGTALIDPFMNLYTSKFYAERNVYLTGITLFLAFVLHRFQAVLLEISTSEAKLAVLHKQYLNSEKEYKRMIDESGSSSSSIKELNKTIADLEKEVTSLKKNNTALETQAKNQNATFVSLMDERDKLERMVNQQRGVVENKKDL